MQTETTTDIEGGGSNIGFIEDGDYTVLQAVQPDRHHRGRASGWLRAGPGGTIELRYDSPTGPLLGKTAMITPTGNWQTYKNVSLPLTGVPAGTHELFVITRNPGQTASLLNLNWIDFVGKGAAQTAAPDVTSTATPLTGAAPLPVAFDTTATDPGRRHAGLRVGLRRARHDDRHVDAAVDPTYTYANQGNYTATLTVTDGQGGTTVKTFAIRVTAPGGLRHVVPRRLRRHRPRRRLGRRAARPGPGRRRRDAEDPDRPGRRLRRRQQRQEHRAARGSGRARGR